VKRNPLRRPGILALAAIVTLGACADAIVGPRARADNAAIFDEVWKQFDLHYSYFSLKRVDWDSLGAQFRPRALAAGSDAELAATLGEMMNTLGDPHVSLSMGENGTSLRYLTPWERSEPRFNESVVSDIYVRDLRATSGGRIRFGTAAPGIGYIRIPSFSGSAGEVDEAVAALAGVESLVLDLRANGGGGNRLAIAMAGRFVQERRLYAWVKLRNGPSRTDFTDFIAQYVAPAGRQFTGRVAVLTDRRTMSSAEDFVLAIRTRAGVTVVGDTTAGASGGPVTRELANGWTYQLSEWMEFTLEKRLFEEVGLAPDIVARPGTAGAGAGALNDPTPRDAALDAALAALRGVR
jgi:C-terminal processing protease CtpA/Prc